MNIYKADGTTRGQIEIGDGSKRTKELGGEDNIVIYDSLAARLDLQIGDYVIIDGERFVLCEQQQPSMDDATGGVEYQLKFEAPYKIWRNKSYKLDPANSASEVSWTNTATLKGHVDTFLKNLEARHAEEVSAGYTEFNYRPKVNGSYSNPYTWAIYGEDKLNLEVQEVEVGGVTYKDTVEYKVVNYDNISTLEALQAIADAWELEWWIDGDTIYFGRCEIDIDTLDTVAFTEGDNIIGMKPSQSQDEYATRLYAFGGTNNVSGRYRKKLIFTPTKNFYQKWLGVDGYSFRDDPSRMINRDHFGKESKILPVDVVETTCTGNMDGRLPINTNNGKFWKLLAPNGIAFTWDTYYVQGTITFPNRPGVYKYSASAHVDLTWDSAIPGNKWCDDVQGLLYFNNNLYDGVEMHCNVRNGNGAIDMEYSGEIVVDASVAGKTLPWKLDVTVFAKDSQNIRLFEWQYEHLDQSKKDKLRPALIIYFTNLPRISCQSVYPFDDNVVLDFDGTDVSAKILPYYDVTSSKWSFGFWIPTNTPSTYMESFQIKTCTHFVIPYVDTAFYTADSQSEDVLKSIHEQRLLLPILSDDDRTDDGANPDAASKLDPEYNGGGYIDIFGDLPPSAIVEKTVTLDDVFPKLNLKVSFAGMTEGDKTYTNTHEDTDEAGNKKTVTDVYYRFKAAYQESDDLFILEQEALIANELKVQFLSGSLAGMTFGLQLVKGHEGMYEVVRSDEYGVSLPNETVYPQAGDKLIIIGWDTAFYSSKDITAIAEIELLKQVKLIAQGIKADTNVYECPMDTNVAYETGILKIGQTIQLNNPLFFDEEGRFSRIIGFTHPLDYPYDNPSYSVGESAKFSRLGNLEANIEGIGYYIAGAKVVANTEKKGQAIKLITSDSSVEPTDGNVYSALRTKTEYVSKKEAENFARTDEYTIFHEDVKMEKSLNVDDNVTAKNGVFVGSTIEVGAGGIQGAGASIYEDADGNSHIEADFLNIRKNATFSQITVAELRHVGGQIALSPASCVIHHVEWYDSDNEQLRQVESERSNVSYYRCYFKADDRYGNEIDNEWVVGDMARCQTFNFDSTRYYWMAVYRKGSVNISVTHGEEDMVIEKYHYIDFTTANYIDHQVGSGHRNYPARDTSATDWPQAGDHLAQLGHLWEEERRAAILLSAYGSGAPSFTLYQDVGKGTYSVGYYSGNYTLANRAIKQMYYDATVNHFVEITGKENDQNGNWMKFSKAGLEIHADLYAQGDTMTLIDKLGETGVIIDGNNRKIRLQAETTEVSNDLLIGGYTYQKQTEIEVTTATAGNDFIKYAQFNPFGYGVTDIKAFNNSNYPSSGRNYTFVTPALYLTPPAMGANIKMVQEGTVTHDSGTQINVVLPFYARFRTNFDNDTSNTIASFNDTLMPPISDGTVTVNLDCLGNDMEWVDPHTGQVVPHDEDDNPIVMTFTDAGTLALYRLLKAGKSEAIKYIGSRVVISNDTDIPICIFGAAGFVNSISDDGTDAENFIFEYTPWARRSYEWKVYEIAGNPSHHNSVDKKVAIAAIEQAKKGSFSAPTQEEPNRMVSVLDENGVILVSPVQVNVYGHTVVVEVDYGIIYESTSQNQTTKIQPYSAEGGFCDIWAYDAQNYGGADPDLISVQAVLGDYKQHVFPTIKANTAVEYMTLVCKAEDGEIFWEIEDYGTL